MLTIRDFWRQGGMHGIEQSAARQAIEEERRRWLPVLEAAVERGEVADLQAGPMVHPEDREVHNAIRRLRRLLKVAPPAPSPERIEQRRQQNRDRVRRFRQRQRQPAAGVEPEMADPAMEPERLARFDAAEARPGSQSRMALSMEQIAAQPERPAFMLLSRYMT